MELLPAFWAEKLGRIKAQKVQTESVPQEKLSGSCIQRLLLHLIGQSCGTWLTLAERDHVHSAALNKIWDVMVRNGWRVALVVDFVRPKWQGSSEGLGLLIAHALIKREHRAEVVFRTRNIIPT